MQCVGEQSELLVREIDKFLGYDQPHQDTRGVQGWTLLPSHICLASSILWGNTAEHGTFPSFFLGLEERRPARVPGGQGTLGMGGHCLSPTLAANLGSLPVKCESPTPRMFCRGQEGPRCKSEDVLEGPEASCV